MPSPFPGMDPWLEQPYWQTVHVQLIAEAARRISEQLGPRYVVLSEQRFVAEELLDGISIASGSTYPDIGVVSQTQSGAKTAGAAVATGPVQIATALPARYRQWSIEVRDTRRRSLVTIIE